MLICIWIILCSQKKITMMLHNFCTLFDSNYLTRALAMYHSIKATGENFVLYVVCFDDLAYKILIKCDLPNLVAIPLDKFESAQLLAVKGDRTAGEYCWTCTSHVIRYVLDTYHLSEVTYLDADLYFYERPSILLDEFRQSGASVLITPHRYTRQYDQSATSGIYCVQFMTFKADKRGLEVLQWWQDRCLEWCFRRIEDGKFGDQKYLDDWPHRFEGIHVLEHLGGGVAPWNIQQYLLKKRLNKIYVNDFLLIFYHYHGYKNYDDDSHDLGSYKLSRAAVKLLYKPYIQALKLAHKEAVNVKPSFNPDRPQISRTWKTPLGNIRRWFRGEFNEYKSL